MGMPDAPTWLIVFCDAHPPPGPASLKDRIYYRAIKLLRPGFRHVYAMRRDPAINGWLIVNVHASRMDPIIQPDGVDIEAGGVVFTAYHYLVDAMVAVGQAHVVTVRQSNPETWVARLPTCVGAIKHLLGVRAAWVWTPYQLYRHLQAMRIVVDGQP